MASTIAGRQFQGLFDVIVDRQTLASTGSVANGASAIIDVTIAGVEKGDFVLAQLVSGSGTGVAGLAVTAVAYNTDTVRLIFNNNSGGALTQASGSWHFIILKPKQNLNTV